MLERKGEDGRKIYCSGLLESAQLDQIFSRGVDTVGATIYDASSGPYRKGIRGKKGLHIDVNDDSAGNAGIWCTDKKEIKSIFLDLAGIKWFRLPYRLKGKRIDALYQGGCFVGFSVPKPESEPGS